MRVSTRQLALRRNRSRCDRTFSRGDSGVGVESSIGPYRHSMPEFPGDLSDSPRMSL